MHWHDYGMIESNGRSWLKSLTWRMLGIVILVAIAYPVTGSWGQTGLVAGIFHTIRFLLYFAHERIWLRIDWGRNALQNNRRTA